MKKIAIMQPYFLPYIGYFQLFKEVDEFVLYDKIKYTKKGWINRNRILTNNGIEYITLPLKKDSDFLMIYERELSKTWDKDRIKMVNRLTNNYRKSPFFKEHFDIINECINQKEINLFDFIYGSIKIINNYLELKTPIIIYSDLGIDEKLKNKEKVIEVCKSLKSNEYINPIGGLNLYSKEEFLNNGIELKFLKVNELTYYQGQDTFSGSLSIADVLMFNSKEDIKTFLNRYSLV
jgi:hypothetical protein